MKKFIKDDHYELDSINKTNTNLMYSTQYNNNDEEQDDILKKLGEITSDEDEKSFDYPIEFNRTKTIFCNNYNGDINQLLQENFAINRNTIACSERKEQKSDKEKQNNNQNERTLNKTFSVQKFSFKNKLLTVNFAENQKNSENHEKLIKKLEKIEMLIKKYNINLEKDSVIKKFINFLKKNKNTDISLLSEKINDLLDFIIDLLEYIKKGNNEIQNQSRELLNINRSSVNIKMTKSSNNVKEQKQQNTINKLQNEIKMKDKEIGELLNKINSKKSQLEIDSKNNTNEILSLRKDKAELSNKIVVLQKQITKLESNNQILEDRMSKYVLEKTSKSGSSVNQIKKSSTLTSFNNLKKNSWDNNEKNKVNEKNNALKKLNLSMINLLKEINNYLCLYDSFLNKECGITKNQSNIAKNLNCWIDLNHLMEENKMKNLCTDFMRNMDKIYNKIQEFLGDKNKEKGICERISVNTTLSQEKKRNDFRKGVNMSENIYNIKCKKKQGMVSLNYEDKK